MSTHWSAGATISTKLEEVKDTKLETRRSEKYKILGKFDIEQFTLS